MCVRVGSYPKSRKPGKHLKMGLPTVFTSARASFSIALDNKKPPKPAAAANEIVSATAETAVTHSVSPSPALVTATKPLSQFPLSQTFPPPKKLGTELLNRPCEHRPCGKRNPSVPFVENPSLACFAAERTCSWRLVLLFPGAPEIQAGFKLHKRAFEHMMDKVIAMKKSKSNRRLCGLLFLSTKQPTSAGEQQHYCAPPPSPPPPLAHSPATLRTSLPKYVHKSTIRISLCKLRT